MANKLPQNNSGLYSLSGFAFQIKVFVWQMSKMVQDQQVEFETADDVVIRRPKEFDTQEEHVRGKVAKAGTKDALELFQVKNTNVSRTKSYKTLCNWFIELNRTPHLPQRFVLIYNPAFAFTNEPFAGDADKVWRAVSQTANKQPQGVASQVKELYKSDIDKFKKDYQYIIERTSIIRVTDIDAEIMTCLAAPLHKDSDESPIYRSRVRELLTKVTSRILDAVAKVPPQPFICSYLEYMQICEQVTRDISMDSFHPDYTAYSRTHEVDIDAPEIISSREYVQLQACRLNAERIKQHLSFNQYYQSVRFHYIEDNMLERVENIETITRENFEDVVAELQTAGHDQPLSRLLKTKDKTNSQISDEFGRWGSCIYLTGENVSDRISWKDDE